MYLISMIVFILFVAFVATMTGVSLAGVFINIPSLIILMGITFPILLASGLFKDFIRALKLMRSKPITLSKIEVEKAFVAVKLAIKSLWLSGLLGMIVGNIAILSSVETLNGFLNSFSVSLIVLFYAVVFIIVLTPVKAKIEAVLKTME